MDPIDSDIIDLDLLQNVHLGLEDPLEFGQTYLVKGTYRYYHYGCDKVNDQVVQSYQSFNIFFIKMRLFDRAGVVGTVPFKQYALGFEIV